MSSAPDWIEAIATVTECRYDAGAGRAMAFGAPLQQHFLIRFNYWAAGDLLTGEFHAGAAIPQGTLFPVRFPSTDPHDVRRVT